MRFVLFSQSIVSDWNHGNAHFQRGLLRELVARGHDAVAYEPAHGWSRRNLVAAEGEAAIDRFHAQFPELSVRTYDPSLSLDSALDGADVVLVHEWNEPWLVAAIGEQRRRGGRFVLLFHDTHHRAISADADIALLDLDSYDAVLAFGEVLSEVYRRRGWGRRVFTWHEAADVRLFRPLDRPAGGRDLVWIGNWGDGERTAELRTFLTEPVSRTGLDATVHGVRYPAPLLENLRAAGVHYRGWLANADVPAAFARHRFTVHLPRRQYTRTLPGIPTIRVFEALACGIPLISAPWDDAEHLFRAGEDYLVAASGEEMARRMREVVADSGLAASLRHKGLQTVLARHTCAHRADELLGILDGLGAGPAFPAVEAAE